MWIFGAEVSIAELLAVFSAVVVFCIFYLAYEIQKLKTVEKRLEVVEKRFEAEEKELERKFLRKKK